MFATHEIHRQPSPCRFAVGNRNAKGIFRARFASKMAVEALHLYPRDVRIFVRDSKEQRGFEEFESASRLHWNQAETLLEAAKRTVEIAIEDSEAAALTYLHDHGNAS